MEVMIFLLVLLAILAIYLGGVVFFLRRDDDGVGTYLWFIFLPIALTGPKEPTDRPQFTGTPNRRIEQ